MGSHSARADLAKNRLYISMKGVLTPEEAKACADEIIAAAKLLGSGFDAVNDITGLQPMSQESVDHSEQAYRYLEACNVRRIIRVVRDVSKGTIELAVQMERTSRRMGFKSEIATSIEHADQMLDLPD